MARTQPGCSFGSSGLGFAVASRAPRPAEIAVACDVDVTAHEQSAAADGERYVNASRGEWEPPRSLRSLGEVEDCNESSSGQRRRKRDLGCNAAHIRQVEKGCVEQDGAGARFGRPRREPEWGGRRLGHAGARDQANRRRLRRCHDTEGAGWGTRSATISTFTTRLASASRTMSFNPPTWTMAPTCGT